MSVLSTSPAPAAPREPVPPHDAEASEEPAAPRTGRERVFAAADALLAAGTPITVTTVRDRAGCSNAVATTHLRAWRSEQAEARAEAARLPELPREVAALVERGVAGLWRQAVHAARREHDDERTDAEQLATALRQDADRLAGALDAAHAERGAVEEELRTTRSDVERLTGRLTAESQALSAATAAGERALGRADELHEALERSRDRIEELRREVGAAERARAGEAEARAQAQGTAAGLQESLAETRTSLEAARTESARAHHDRVRAESEREGALGTARRLEGEVTALREALQSARAQASDAERDRAEQLAARAQAEGEAAGLREALAAAVQDR
ncbi:DNA-binding protein [Isoptericola aurantiacus]|uniref:DNA-binding protein n=1 Tax=Isoptericola aurantiacus TaxID=3377839 RepID=UPI00383AEA0A